MANVILDLENYELSDSSVHTIEIGVTLLDDISLKHSYDSSNYVIFDDDNNIKLINSKHRPTSLGQRYYHFNNGDYFKITNLNAPFGTNDKAIDKELEQCSGIPDIKIYVTSLEEGTPVSNTDSSMLETLIHKDTPKE